jgi:hypothetical protein
MDNVGRSHPEVDTFVDNSKKTTWAEKFLDLPDVKQGPAPYRPPLLAPDLECYHRQRGQCVRMEMC